MFDKLKKGENNKVAVAEDPAPEKPTPKADVELAREGVEQHPPMTFKRAMALFSLACLLAAAQIPLYLIGGALSYIVQDIGGETDYAWLGIVYTLAVASIAPFAGATSDFMGRRYAALSGAGLVVVGMIIVGTSHRMNVAIGGMAITGVGAGLAEVIGTAGISELAPVESRGKYVGIAYMLILPFAASSGYAQIYSASATWRYGAWINIILNGGTFILLALFYWPPPRVNSAELSKTQILARVDYIGGILSIGGFALFILGIEWGGYQYPWKSAHVLVPLCLGGFMIIVFTVWENFAPYPMIPAWAFKNKRISVLTLFITGVAGANFYSLLNFWPLEAQILYGPDPHRVARTIIPFGYAVASGVIFVNLGLSYFHGANRELLVISSAMMTAGVGALAAVNAGNQGLGIGMSVLGGFGVGGIIIPAAVILTIVSPDEVIATVAAINLSIRFVGGSIGYAIYFNVFQNKLNSVIPTLVGTAVVEAGLPLVDAPALIGALVAQNVTAATEVPGVTQQILLAATVALQDSYVEGFRRVYLVSIAFGGAAVIASVFLGEINRFMVSRVAVDIH